ncbi:MULTISPECIES: HAD family phosphatase [unclassified Paraburkholderia]|uniref:HAD family hydrolase n=1 Tax=unclassified Paraburkholderia TaxID=2615204 RepID=UPI002AAF9EBA|nr:MULTISPECIES: HAD family phosphatase [unclassified Paraburkholderia]
MSAFPQLPFDAVLFDCDGVLVDSERITHVVLVQMLGELGWTLSVDEAMGIFVGKMVKDEAARIEAQTGFRLTEAWLEGFRARRNEALARDLIEIPGAPDAVRAVRDAYDGRIAVASGADRRKVELQLNKVGLLASFGDHIYSGHETPRSKPHPDVYLAAAAGLGVDPRRCAVVEDTVTGARAGLAAGATVFGYSPAAPGHSSAEALKAEGVAHVFTDMAQLPALLTRWNPA